MKTTPLKEGALMMNSPCLGRVTRDMIHTRTAELAIIDGRSPNDTTMSDLAQAKRELTGEPN